MKFLVESVDKVNHRVTERKLPVFLWNNAMLVFKKLFNIVSCALARKTNHIQIAWMVGSTVVEWYNVFKCRHVGVVEILNHELATTRARETDP